MGLDRVKNKDDRAAIELILAQQETGFPYLAPPGVPADRLRVLESAFDATIKDQDYIAAAQQGNLPLMAPVGSAYIHSLIQKAYATPSAIVAQARSLLERAVQR